MSSAEFESVFSIRMVTKNGLIIFFGSRAIGESGEGVVGNRLAGACEAEIPNEPTPDKPAESRRYMNQVTITARKA